MDFIISVPGFNKISIILCLQACEKKQWSLVRHTAGLLQKRVEDLAEVSINEIALEVGKKTWKTVFLD